MCLLHGAVFMHTDEVFYSWARCLLGSETPGLPLGAAAPVMTPCCPDFFCSFLRVWTLLRVQAVARMTSTYMNHLNARAQHA